MTTLIRERLKGQSHDLGDGFMIRRLLPSPSRHVIGPFNFMDHFGPLQLPAMQALDVRPHPHIGLATVTYLWEGRIEDKDALGNTQIIEPGAVNWMTARRYASTRDEPNVCAGCRLLPSRRTDVR